MNEQQDYYDFIRLLTGSDTLSQHISGELVHSDTEPAGFIQLHPHVFSDRNVHVPHPEQTLWFLIDTLSERGYVRELEWNCTPSHINQSIQSLCPQVRLDDILEENDAGTLSEMLEAIDTFLQDEYDLTILFFPPDANGYTVAVVDLENWEELDVMLRGLFGR